MNGTNTGRFATRGPGVHVLNGPSPRGRPVFTHQPGIAAPEAKLCFQRDELEQPKQRLPVAEGVDGQQFIVDERHFLAEELRRVRQLPAANAADPAQIFRGNSTKSPQGPSNTNNISTIFSKKKKKSVFSYWNDVTFPDLMNLRSIELVLNSNRDWTFPFILGCVN